MDESVKFSVTFLCSYISELIPKITRDTLTDIVYIIRGSGPLTFSMPEYEWKPSNCTTNLKYTLQNLSTGEPSLDYPQFFFYNGYERTVTLNGDRDAYDERDKEFKFQLKVMTEHGAAQNTEYKFAISTFFKNEAPKLLKILEPQFPLGNETSSWELPQVYDPEND